MANVKISALPAVTTVVPGSDVLPLVSGGITTKATPNQIVQAVLPAPGAIGGTTPNAGAFTTLSASSTVSGTGFSTYLASPPAIGGTVPAAGAFSTLSASSTVSGTGFSTYLASPPAIGGTTPAAGSFTTLSTTGNVTLGDASGDTVTFNAATVTLNNSTTLSAASTKTLTLNGGAGSNGLVLDASNNVGIGTSSPGYKLDVNSGSNAFPFRLLTTTTNALQVFADSATTGIGPYVGSSGNNLIFGRAGVAEYMRLDSSGRLGIGNNSPNYALSVNGVGNFYSGVAGLGRAFFGDPADPSGYIGIYRSTLGPTNYNTAGNGFNFASIDGYTFSTGPASYGTQTERMRIDSSGNLIIGNTSTLAGASLSVYGSVIAQRSPLSPTGRYWKQYVENSAANILIINDANSGVILNYGSTAWAANSDERLKTDLKPIENAAQKVSSLRAVTGRFKTDEEGVSRSFLIAQDVQAVLPEAVSEEGDEMKTLNIRYTETIPLLVAAIKELSAELNELKQKVNA